MFTKRCGKCGHELPADTDRFYPDASKASGLSSYCRPCRRRRSADYAAENVGAVKAHQRRYYEGHAPTIRGRSKAWYEANRERAAVLQRQRASRTPEQQREYKRTWRRRYPERKADIQRRRRAAAAGGGGSHTTEQWLALCARFGGVCVRCGVAGPLERDHVLPLTKGGSDDIGNVQPLCRSCNASKNDRHVDYRLVRN